MVKLMKLNEVKFYEIIDIIKFDLDFDDIVIKESHQTKFEDDLMIYNRLKSDFIEVFDAWKKYIHLRKNYVNTMGDVLDDAVYGHDEAKRQIKRIIGQWINGEQQGFCVGFEGPPGCGKTSMGKHGISKMLTDDDGNSRPFAFLPVGGTSNGSTLEGHNYTYVGSTWGRIVDILIETKCMNPVVFIDELDKVSRTEHGKRNNFNTNPHHRSYTESRVL